MHVYLETTKGRVRVSPLQGPVHPIQFMSRVGAWSKRMGMNVKFAWYSETIDLGSEKIRPIKIKAQVA